MKIEIRELDQRKTTSESFTLILGRYDEVQEDGWVISYSLQFSETLERWIFSGHTPEQWVRARKMSKLDFLLRTGQDVNSSVVQFLNGVMRDCYPQRKDGT